MDTQYTVDVLRPKFSGFGAADYDIELIARGEWCNYTRTITPGSYFAYLRSAAAAAQDMRLDLVTGNRASSNQAVACLGTFHVPNTGGVGVFGYAALSDVLGNPLPLELSGVTTLRLTAMTANNDLSLNYLVLVPTTAPTAPVVSVTPSPSATGVLPDASVEAAIYDGSSPVDPSSVVLTVNGSVVSAPATKSGSITLVKYTPPALWPALSANTVTLAYSDGTPRNASWGFTVAYLPSLTPGMKVGSAGTPGFVWRVFQSEVTTDPSTTRAANELAGTSGIANNADPSQQSIASAPGTPASPGNGPITFNIPTVINMSGLNTGPWGWPYGNFGPDDQMPGLPGIGNVKDGIAADAVTFLQLPAGVITMPINCDDGFQLMAGYLNDAPLLLADQEGQHTPEEDNVVQFIVEQPGLYPFRLLYYQAVQDYALEWSSIRRADGVYLLVNDTTDGGIPAYQVGTVPAAPHPTLTAQTMGSGRVKIAWGAEGTLQVATSVTGPYTDVTGAASPYTVTPSGALFFRVRVP